MYYAVMAKQRSIVADRIEELLRIKDMSAADLSRASGVKETSISNILSGVRKQPRSDTVQKIAKGFPTSTDYLNGYTDNHEPTDAPSLPEYAAEVLESMRQLGKGQNYQLSLIAKSFVEESANIRHMTRQEIMDALLDVGDEVLGEEETNQVIKLLQELERKWNSDGKPAALTAGDPATNPSE